MNIFEDTVIELLGEADATPSTAPVVKQLLLYNKPGTSNFLTGVNDVEKIDIHDGDVVTELNGKIYLVKPKGSNSITVKYGSTNSKMINVAQVAPTTAPAAPVVEPTV